LAARTIASVGVFCSALGNLAVPTRICALISGTMTYCFGAFAAREYDALLKA
jgi:hypothetical protein